MAASDTTAMKPARTNGVSEDLFMLKEIDAAGGRTVQAE
jgi:hypothetical protein